MFKCILFITFLSLQLNTFADGLPIESETNNAANALSGSFVYKGIDAQEVKLECTGNYHIEKYNNGKYYIKSKIQWISDEKFVLKVVENTLPNSQVKIGSEMLMEIHKIKKHKITYFSYFEGQAWTTSIKRIQQ